MNSDHSVVFEIASKYCISESCVHHDGYSISSKGFLPTVVDKMVIWVKFIHSSLSYFTDSQNVDVHSCHLLFDHFQFALIHGPNIPGSYAICSLQHQTLLLSPVPSTTGYCFCFGSIRSFFLELFLHWSPVAYHFAFPYCSWGSQGKNTEVVCHSLLQWTTFCQTSPPWPIPFGWPNTAWLSFIELDKTVVRVTRLASFLWLWF